MNASRWSSGSPNRGACRVGNQVDFPGAGADRVPVGEHDALAVAEQVPPPGVAVDHPGRELEAELAVGVQELLAARPAARRVLPRRWPRLDSIARRTETSGW